MGLPDFELKIFVVSPILPRLCAHVSSREKGAVVKQPQSDMFDRTTQG